MRFDATLGEKMSTGMKKLYADSSQDNETRANALFVHAFVFQSSGKSAESAKILQLAQHLLPEDPGFHTEDLCLFTV